MGFGLPFATGGWVAVMRVASGTVKMSVKFTIGLIVGSHVVKT